MCGIVGFCGKKDALDFLLDGLERLEYRGYDSSGVALLDAEISCVKATGRIKNLRAKISEISAKSEKSEKAEVEKVEGQSGGIRGSVGIGHTRWATHGAPSDTNAHPHLSKNKKFAVVHNGIIENYVEIRRFLAERFFPFASETDTEVIAHLAEYYYRGDPLDALVKVAQRLKGSYALAVLCADTPSVLYAMRKDSPLVIGLGGEGMLASDTSPLLGCTRDFIVPEAGEIAVITPQSVRVLNFNGEEVIKQPFHADWDDSAAQKEGFPHFMLKEIYEQPRAVADTVNALLPRLNGLKTLQNVTKINIVGCGSACHAGIAAKYFIEKTARIPVECETASEFRYKNPIINKGDLTIAVSQSGETADTIAAINEAKKFCPVLSVVNVLGSTAARISDEVIYTLAGPEISVATTKGYLSQVTALYLIGLHLARQKGFKVDGLEKELLNLPAQIDALLKNKELFQQLSVRFCSLSAAFFIGRGIDCAIAMEGALKLKEISYIHAQSYAAGELKHGTISLVEDGSLIVAVCTDRTLMEKTLSNINEVKTRGGVVFGISCFQEIRAACNYFALIPEGLNAPFLSAVALQLFAYHVALNRACDIDKPRNLAKSVTVE